jgi:thioredoxin-related protein
LITNKRTVKEVDHQPHVLLLSLAVKQFLKTIALLVVVLITSTTVCADEWDMALKKAKKEDKPVVLYFFTAYCSYCRAMDKEVLADKEVSATLKKNAVYLRIDVEKRDDLARFYGVRGYPTTTFLEPNGQRIAQIPGYIERDDFKRVLAFVKGKHYKTMNLKEFLRKQALGRPLQDGPETLEGLYPIRQGQVVNGYAS